MASKRNKRRHACEGKKRYESQGEAIEAVAGAQRRTGDWLIAYHCKFCGGWHIGHPPKKVRQSISARLARG